jgi:hypothetical protein
LISTSSFVSSLKAAAAAAGEFENLQKYKSLSLNYQFAANRSAGLDPTLLIEK